jgi:hypothetical protein
MQNSRLKIQNCLGAFCVFSFVFLTAGCSLPNLEMSECSAARDSARQFYSFHFGNDMKPTAENIKLRERFLTPEFFQESMKEIETVRIDPFTGTDPPPTTFKIGKCVSDQKEADFEVQLYWRTDAATKQDKTNVALVNRDGRWLVSQIGKIF